MRSQQDPVRLTEVQCHIYAFASLTWLCILHHTTAPSYIGSGHQVSQPHHTVQYVMCLIQHEKTGGVSLCNLSLCLQSPLCFLQMLDWHDMCRDPGHNAHLLSQAQTSILAETNPHALHADKDFHSVAIKDNRRLLNIASYTHTNTLTHKAVSGWVGLWAKALTALHRLLLAPNTATVQLTAFVASVFFFINVTHACLIYLLMLFPCLLCCCSSSFFNLCAIMAEEEHVLNASATVTILRWANRIQYYLYSCI